MNDIVWRVKEAILKSNLQFSSKPILIGGQAMEYYDIRKSGKDIDFVITDKDYQSLAEKYPEKRKDLYGDLGVTVDEFEIWRSIAHLDYDFFRKEAVDEGDKWTRVCAMDVEKYLNDLKLVKEYYYEKYTNQQYHKEALLHENSYKKMNGVVFSGKYEDD